MSAMDRLLDRARCSGIQDFTRDELALMREHLDTLTPPDRVLAVYPHGDHLAEPIIDDLWERLGREPNVGEYLVLSDLFRQAAAKCEKEAVELSSHTE